MNSHIYIVVVLALSTCAFLFGACTAQPGGGGEADEANSGREPSEFELKAMVALQRADLHVRMGDIEDAREVFMKCMQLPSPKRDVIARRLQRICSVRQLWKCEGPATQVQDRCIALGPPCMFMNIVLMLAGGSACVQTSGMALPLAAKPPPVQVSGCALVTSSR